MNDTRPTVLDVFAGIGGFSLAFEREGFRTIGFSEIDPYASAVLRKHWPHVPNYGDIRNVPAGLRVDVVAGGPPCQPASLAGKRRGASDDRWLCPEALACVERVRPAFCLFENPPGIVSVNGGLEFERVLSGLESLGYAVQPIYIPACAVDARHLRNRVWLLAHAQWLRGEWGRPGGNGAAQTGTCDATPGSSQGCEVVAAAGRTRLEEREEQSAREECEAIERGGDDLADSAFDIPHGAGSARNGRAEPADGCVWEPEPDVGRVAPRVPNRVDRLRCLGNSVVPQVVQIFARAIYRELMHERVPNQAR